MAYRMTPARRAALKRAQAASAAKRRRGGSKVKYGHDRNGRKNSAPLKQAARARVKDRKRKNKAYYKSSVGKRHLSVLKNPYQMKPGKRRL